MEQIINKFVSDEIKLLFIPGLTAFIISYLGTIYVIKLAKKWGLVDDPKKHKHPKVIHTYPVPRGGGLAIFLAVLFAASIYLPFDKHLRGIILGAFILTMIIVPWNWPRVTAGIIITLVLSPISNWIGFHLKIKKVWW